MMKAAAPGIEWKFENFIIDFEFAVIKAIKLNWPYCLIVLCFFHLGQSLQRRVQAEGLTEAYTEDDVKRQLVNALKVI